VKTPARVSGCRRVGFWAVVGILVTASSGGASGGIATAAAPPPAGRCALTQGEFGDPGYRPNAPVRSHVGTGFVLNGIVRSGIDCAVMRGTRVEFWLAGPNGYDEAHRGTLVTDGNGRYRLESNLPSGSFGRQPHIHLRVAAPGYRTLVTAYFPRAGAVAGTFDLVLEPEV